MALLIATSDVVAEARLVSLDSTTKKHDNYGCEAELIYRFEVVQYLKGEGNESLDVRINSGPKYVAFPDVIGERTQSEALEFAEAWLRRSKAAVDDKRNAILLLGRFPEIDDHYFMSFEDEHGRYPAVGETWLYGDKDSMYRHQLTDGEPATISLADLHTRIEDLRRLTEGGYERCVVGALDWRDRVRRQLLGTYRVMSIAGYREPEPFPRYEVELESPVSSYSKVFAVRRTPYEPPLFSDYWLDGKDRDLFRIETDFEPEYTYESMAVADELPQGVYSVHFGQYHQSLPCDEESSRVEGAWRRSEAAEWVVRIKSA